MVEPVRGQRYFGWLAVADTCTIAARNSSRGRADDLADAASH